MVFDQMRFQNETFSPDTLTLLSSAFDSAWNAIVKSGAKFADGEVAATRERLAKRILETARTGERDTSKLVSDALEHLTRPMSEPKPLTPD